MINHNHCRSIIIEGQDSLGKSLQTGNVVEHFKKRGFSVARIKSPYNERFSFKIIYWMLGNGLARKFPNVFQFVHFFNKLLFQWFILPGLLKKNDYIIFDRWCISMWTYGVSDGANEKLTRWMLNMIEEPDITILLDGERFERERSDDSYEMDVEYQKRVRGMYLNWAFSHDHKRVCVINANQEPADVTKDIVKSLREKGIVA